VAASIGIESGECPHCHKPIPAEPQSDAGATDPAKNVKLL
jgi:hypothetical protein